MPDLLRLEDVGTAIGVLLFCCAAVMTLWGAWKVVREISKPSSERAKKLDKLEEQSKDNSTRIDELTQSVRLLLQSQISVIDHLTTGDHVQQLEKMSERLRDYIWDTWGEGN